MKEIIHESKVSSELLQEQEQQVAQLKATLASKQVYIAEREELFEASKTRLQQEHDSQVKSLSQALKFLAE